MVKKLLIDTCQVCKTPLDSNGNCEWNPNHTNDPPNASCYNCDKTPNHRYKCTSEFCVFGRLNVAKNNAQPRPTLPAANGWICPVCGAGNAPTVDRCSCVQQPVYSSQDTQIH